MVNSTTYSPSKIEVLDQLLEDLAGEEINEFDNDLDLNADLDIYADTDDFADIDSFH